MEVIPLILEVVGLLSEDVEEASAHFEEI